MTSSTRVLEPIDRVSEVLFGLIMDAFNPDEDEPTFVLAVAVTF